MAVTHERLTVVAIYGQNDGSAALPSLLHSVAELPGSRGLLLSLARPAGLPTGIEWRGLSRMSYEQYSLFVMHGLHFFIETDFCLIVQDDGWVLDGRNFLPEYYGYDYIGAPCHAALVGDELMLRYQWIHSANPVVVQNGGFSLRSRRMLAAPSKYGIMHTLHTTSPLWNEDIQLTCLLRPQLERCGIRFAPIEVAKQFAVEYLGPKVHDDLEFTRLLGHHAVTRKLISDRTVFCKVPAGQASAWYREPEMLQFLEQLGYRVEYAPNDRL